jgi:2-C-methyl-D-erythritol 4-phosphate cytidylyltransferase
MIYAGILAAGLGLRMHRQDLPKQFLPLGEKPILIHTLEQFYLNPNVGRIIVVAPDSWKLYTEDLLAKYDSMEKEYFVISGGENKTESIYLLSRFIDSKWGTNSEDILVAHDAIRPFVTQRIIDENIAAVKRHGAANTAMVTNDALLVSRDGKVLDDVPPHEHIYAEQTPQSYSLKRLNDTFKYASDNGIALRSENELPRLYIKAKNEMCLVRGEYYNIKIVGPYDLEVSNALLKEQKAR